MDAKRRLYTLVAGSLLVLALLGLRLGTPARPTAEEVRQRVWVMATQTAVADLDDRQRRCLGQGGTWDDQAGRCSLSLGR